MTAQLKILQSVRKPLPPVRRVILDKRTKARRKRVKRVEPYVIPSWLNTL